MKTTSSLAALFAGVCLFATSALAQTSVSLNWNFGTSSSVTTPTGLITGLSGGTLATNNQNGTVSSPFGTTSASTTYAGASGQYNAGIAARTGTLNTSSGGSGYYSINLIVDSGYSLSISGISLGSRSTSTGPTSLAVYSDANSYGSSYGNGSMSANSTWAKITPTLSSITATGSVELRLYGYGGTGSPSAGTINWRIDDLTITGTLSPVPEPSTYAAIAGVLALGGVMWQRRRQRAAASPQA